MNRVFVALALLVPLAGAACEKSGADAQREADKAQAKSTTEITNAQAEADKKSEKAQAEANEKISKAQADFAKTREDYRHTVQSDLTDVDKKLADLDAKATKGQKVRGDLNGLHRDRDAFAADARSLDTATPVTFDAIKDRLDKERDDLKKAMGRVH